MLKAKRFLAVDIDSDIIRIIEVEKKNSVKHLMIKQIIETRLTNNNNQADSREVRVNSVSTVIKELLQKNKITFSPIIFCLSGTDAMIKYVTVPPVKKQNLNQIMKYEVQMQIPFPVEQIYQDYQLSEIGDMEDKQVLLAVARKEVVNNYIELFSKIGLKVVCVGISSLAAFNAVTLCISQEPEQVNLLVSLRQTLIDLCILQNTHLHLARSVPFALPEQYPPLPETLSKALEGCLSHIEQTIAYHRSKSDKRMGDISKIILSGPEDMLPHFKKFMEDKLNLMVEIASPFKTLDNLSCQQNQQKDADFTVAVGLALQAVDLVPIKINLLSSHLKEKQTKREGIRYRWGSFIFAALLPLVYNSGFVNQLSMKEDAFKRLQSELKEYDKAIPDIRQIDILKQEDQTITTDLHELKAQVIHSHSLIKILSELSRLIPDEVWINYLSAGISGDLKISGHATGYESIKVFINNLENSKMFKQVKLITANSSGDKNEYIDFSIEVMEP